MMQDAFLAQHYSAQPLGDPSIAIDYHGLTVQTFDERLCSQLCSPLPVCRTDVCPMSNVYANGSPHSGWMQLMMDRGLTSVRTPDTLKNQALQGS